MLQNDVICVINLRNYSHISLLLLLDSKKSLKSQLKKMVY